MHNLIPLKKNYRKSLSFKTMTICVALVFILLKPQSSSFYIHFEGLILWNAGYSNFMTKVDAQSCLHSDPGGTLGFPPSLIALCSEKENRFILLHEDRYHTSFQRNLQQLGATESKEFSEFHNIKFYIAQSLLSIGHLDRANLAVIFNRADLLQSVQYLMLPNHGQSQFLRPSQIHHYKNFKMIISGSQSRKYSPHTKTQQIFSKFNLPLVFKSTWGHLVFYRTR